MKIFVIVNPSASRADGWSEIERALGTRADITVRHTNESGDARRFARDALEDGYDLIVAGGGDGTVNEVINGLAPDSSGIVLAVLPLGTGNDLGRSLGLPPNPTDAWRAIEAHDVRTLDLIEATSSNTHRYCINIASGGLSGAVGREISTELKSAWGSMAYLISAIQVAAKIRPYRTVLTYSDDHREEYETVNVFVANCAWTGSGMEVAPGADPTDGMLDVVTLVWDSTWEVAASLPAVLQGAIHATEIVRRRNVSSLSIESDPPMPFNLDGEPFTDQPITFNVVPKALQILVGPECGF